MNENKKGLLILGVVLVIVACIILMGIFGGESSKSIYNKFINNKNGENVSLIYIGKPTCPACQLLSPSLEEMKARYNFDDLYINTDKMNSKYMNQIMTDLGLTTINTPYLAIVSNGKIIAFQDGYENYDKTFNFLKENGIIAKDAANYQKQKYEEFETAFKSTKSQLIYMQRPTCHYCQLLSPSLKEMKDRYKFNYIDINTDEIISEYMNKIVEKLNIKSVSTPYLAIVNNGKIVETQNGYQDYDLTFKFLQKNGIVAKDATLTLNYIGMKEYKDLLGKDESSIVVIGQSTCGYCVEAKIILNKIVDKNKTKINYLNISYLSEDEGKQLQESVDYFKNEKWGTPLTFVLKDGKVIDVLEGYTTLEKYEEFFKKNGVL